MITRQEENKITWISAASSVLITGLIILLLILWIIHVPNPPEIAGGSAGTGETGSISVSLGTDDAGFGAINDYKFPEPVNSTPVTNAAAADNSVLISSEDGVNINEVKTDKPVDTNTPTPNNNTVTTNPNPNNNNPTKPNKWADALNNASNGGNSGNNPNNPNGVMGDPTGTSPNFGSTGGNTATGGTTGNTKGPGGTGFGTGRKTLVMPCRPNITKREGKVVVIIKVNRNGDVVDADPNGPGTDTSDPELKLQARQAALCAKFEACSNCDEYSRGTIIFDFGYGNK